MKELVWPVSCNFVDRFFLRSVEAFNGQLLQRALPHGRASDTPGPGLVNLDESAIAARNVSIARAAACCFRDGRPPTALTISLRVNCRASATGFPSNISASAEPQASVGGQPYARNRAVSMRPLRIKRPRRRRSPQTGFDCSATAFASGSSPALRGWAR